MKKILAGVFNVLLIFFFLLSPAFAADLILHAINVGQGDSILVQFPTGENMLVDTGSANASYALIQYLQGQGVEKINILVGTHPHEDHIGSSVAVLRAFPVGKVWDSGYAHGSQVQKRYLEEIRAKGVRFGQPKAGFSEQIGAAKIEVLGPAKEISGTNSDANNNCLVLRISYGKVSFLLMGDAEEAERATLGTLPRSTVLKVGHHGSHNGTDAALLGQVKPEVAVISCGVGNSYGHPHKETLSALRAAKVKWYTTTGGSVVISTDGTTYSVKQDEAGSVAVAAPVVGTKEKPAASSTSAGGYIGNQNTRKFHRLSCGSLPAPKNQVVLKTREEAVGAGFVPCKKCKP